MDHINFKNVLYPDSKSIETRQFFLELHTLMLRHSVSALYINWSTKETFPSIGVYNKYIEVKDLVVRFKE